MEADISSKMAKDESKFQWMNQVAIGRSAYQPTTVEHWANILSHGLFVVPTCWLVWLLVESVGICDVTSSLVGSELRTVACAVYGGALVMLFAVSTVFHIVCYSGKRTTLKDVLHRADRAMIYLFIASSYTPWLLLKTLPLQSWTVHLRWGIWVLAVVGILYQQVFHEMFKMVDTIFYVVIGLAPSLAVVEMHDEAGLLELKIGGLLYIVGVVFFKMDGRLPFAHAVWHLFVVAGSYVHYTAVTTYLTHCATSPQLSVTGGNAVPFVTANGDQHCQVGDATCDQDMFMPLVG